MTPESRANIEDVMATATSDRKRDGRSNGAAQTTGTAISAALSRPPRQRSYCWRS